MRRNGCNHTSDYRTTPTDVLSWSRLTTNANPTHRFASGHTLPVSCRVLRSHRTPALLLTHLTSAATSLPRAAQWARPPPPSWPPYNEISPDTPGRLWSKLALIFGLLTFLKANSEACKFTLSRSTALVYFGLKRRPRLCCSSVWSVCLARHDLSTTRSSFSKPWRRIEINHPWALAILSRTPAVTTLPKTYVETALVERTQRASLTPLLTSGIGQTIHIFGPRLSPRICKSPNRPR